MIGSESANACYLLDSLYSRAESFPWRSDNSRSSEDQFVHKKKNTAKASSVTTDPCHEKLPRASKMLSEVHEHGAAFRAQHLLNDLA
jgi:hypothetical protein